MSDAVAGSLSLTAGWDGTRTVLQRVRYDGIARCSRAFRHGDAALVVCSQLGPGVVRGDRVATAGTVGRDAHLIVTQQTATRLLGGPRPSRATATWTVGAGATLELIGEPLVAAPDAAYDATTVIELGAGARVLISDVACVSRDASIRTRTSVRHAGREIYYDAVDPAAAAPLAVGTLALLDAAPDRAALLLADCDRATAEHSDAAVRIGVGMLPDGVFVRVLAGDTWHVRALLAALRFTLMTATGHTPAQRAGGVIPVIGSSGAVSAPPSSDVARV